MIFIGKSFRTIVFVFIGGFSQRFGRCIIRPSSGVSCLSGHRNDSTREIIFKVWLLINKWFPCLNHFYAQINRRNLRKAGGYSGRNVVEKNNKDKDNSPKTLTDDKLFAYKFYIQRKLDLTLNNPQGLICHWTMSKPQLVERPLCYNHKVHFVIVTRYTNSY